MNCRKYVILLFVMLLVLTAAGCQKEAAPIPTSAAFAETVQTAEATEETETAEPEPVLSAREMYWKMRGAQTMKFPSCYTVEQVMFCKVGDGALVANYEIWDREQVILSPSPLQLNIATERTEVYENEKVVSRQVTYYRSKGTNKAEMFVYYGEPLNKWIYAEPTDDNWGLLNTYQRTLYPMEFPENMTLDPETQIVEGRETYVLRYSATAQDLLRWELTEEEKEALNKLLVEYALYVDKETYTLIQTAEKIVDPGEAISKALFLMATGVIFEGEENVLTVTSFTQTYRHLDYEQAEMPPIPEEAFKSVPGFEVA